MKTRLSTLIACGLAVAALAVAGCGDAYNSPATPSPSTPGSSNLTISIVTTNGNLSFSPNSATVKMGQTVTWYDADLAAHVVVADDGSFKTGSIQYLGMSAPITMSAPGSFSYRLEGNSAVAGTLVVTQ
jgi:plastocyanin